MPESSITATVVNLQGVTEVAQSLCQKRDAQIYITGMGGDQFFGKLAEKVDAAKAMDAPHPLSAKMAVATLKKYVVNPLDEIQAARPGHGRRTRRRLRYSPSKRRSRTWKLTDYESRLDILLPLALAAAGYWGKPSQRRLWLRCFRQFVTSRSGSMGGFFIEMDYYPAYLILYAFGIAAMAGGRPGNLAYILAKAKARNSQAQDEPLLKRLVSALTRERVDRAAPVFRPGLIGHFI